MCSHRCVCLVIRASKSISLATAKKNLAALGENTQARNIKRNKKNANIPFLK